MSIRSFSIAGALLLGAAPLVAQATPDTTPPTAAGVVDPNTTADPVPTPLSGKPAPKHKASKSKAVHTTPSIHADRGMADQTPTNASDPK